VFLRGFGLEDLPWKRWPPSLGLGWDRKFTVFLRGFGVRAIKPQVFLRVLRPCSRQTMCFYMVLA
jgi:hypothetical protein